MALAKKQFCIRRHVGGYGGCEVAFGDDGERPDNRKDLPKIVVVENADPANTHAFRAGGQPKVFDRATCAVKVSIHDCVPSEHVRSRPQAIACHTKVDRGLFNPFELQRTVKRRSIPGVVHGGAPVLRLTHRFNKSFRSGIADDKEVPGLHESDRGAVVGSRENAEQHLVGNRIRPKGTHVSAALDDSIECCAVFRRKRLLHAPPPNSSTPQRLR